jgi:hypothetical protein
LLLSGNILFEGIDTLKFKKQISKGKNEMNDFVSERWNGPFVLLQMTRLIIKYLTNPMVDFLFGIQNNFRLCTRQLLFLKMYAFFFVSLSD